MLKTIIVLPDGREISSGAQNTNAIQSVTLTELVNDSQELNLGSACANMLEAKLITPQGGLQIAAGDELTVYKEDSAGTRHKVGLFTAEKPTRPSANTMAITAYDRVSWLDKDLTGWLAGLSNWPYALYDLAKMVCAECGLTLKNTSLPNGDYPVQAFSAEGITGRDLLRWVGQAAGRFCRATADGEIEFAWYSVKNITYTPTGEHFYYQNGLSYEDYQVAAIRKVQLRQTAQDVGTVYPDLLEDVNTYTVTGNYLLTTADAAARAPIAQHLYSVLKWVTYTPCKISVPASVDVHAGDIVSITDPNGKTITAWVMKKTQAGQRDTLECTGSRTRDSAWAVNNQTFQALSGKVLNLTLTVEGLKAENKDAAGNLAALALDVSGISTDVLKQQTDMDNTKTQISQIRQNADTVSIQLKDIRENGVSRVETTTGYTFAADGLRIQKSGEQIENRLDHTGMYVTRAGETMLQANKDGVIATDVTVRNYLIVGTHARLEDYTNGADTRRTACFYV